MRPEARLQLAGLLLLQLMHALMGQSENAARISVSEFHRLPEIPHRSLFSGTDSCASYLEPLPHLPGVAHGAPLRPPPSTGRNLTDHDAYGLFSRDKREPYCLGRWSQLRDDCVKGVSGSTLPCSLVKSAIHGLDT